MTQIGKQIELNQGLSSQHSRQNLGSAGSGAGAQNSTDLYAQFTAILDKIAFELSAQAEISENIALAEPVPVKVEEVQDVKEKAALDLPSNNLESNFDDSYSSEAEDRSQAENIIDEQVPDNAEKLDAKAEEVEVDQQVSAEDPTEAKAEAQQADKEELAEESLDEQDLDTAENADLKVAKELKVIDETVVQATNELKANKELDPKSQNESAKLENIVDVEAELKGGEQGKSEELSKVMTVAQEVVSEHKTDKELSLKDKIEVVSTNGQELAPNTKQEAGEQQHGDLIDRMARSLLGKIQNQEAEESFKLATEKLALDVNYVRPKVELNQDIRSTVLSATMLKQLLDSSQMSLDSASKSANQSAQQAIVAPFAAQKTDNSSAEQGKAQLTKFKKLPRSLARKTLQRVEEALKEVAKTRDGKTISVRLDPPQLGNVKIDVSLRDGMLRARLVAESPVVTNLLREKGAELQGILRKLGFDLSDVNVSIGYGDPQDSSHNTGNLDREQEKENEFNNGSDLASTLAGASNKESSVNSTVEDHWIA